MLTLLERAMLSKSMRLRRVHLKIQLQSLKVRGPNPDLEGAFQAAAKGRVTRLSRSGRRARLRYQKRIADLAIKNRLPSMSEASEFVEAGGAHVLCRKRC